MICFTCLRPVICLLFSSSYLFTCLHPIICLLFFIQLSVYLFASNYLFTCFHPIICLLVFIQLSVYLFSSNYLLTGLHPLIFLLVINYNYFPPFIQFACFLKLISKMSFSSSNLLYARSSPSALTALTTPSAPSNPTAPTSAPRYDPGSNPATPRSEPGAKPPPGKIQKEETGYFIFTELLVFIYSVDPHYFADQGPET